MIEQYNGGIINDSDEFTYQRDLLINKNQLYSEDSWFYKTHAKGALRKSRGASTRQDDLKNDNPPDGWNDILKHTNNFNVAVDIGARVGEWARPLSTIFNKVISFEPKQKWCECFIKNVKMKHVKLYQCGLSDENKWAEMDGNSFRQGHSADGIINYLDEGECMQLKTLDSFNIPKIDFMKIDVDGLEMKVILGGEATLLRTKPIMMIECCPKYNYQEYCKYIEDLGAKHIKDYMHKNKLHDRLYMWE